MIKSFCLILVCCAFFLFCVAEGQEAETIKEIAPQLPEKPCGVGPAIDNRALWDEAARDPAFQKVIKDAEAILDEPIPELPDDLYLDFSRTGNRTRWQNKARTRHRRVPTFALAECLENRGRFLPALEASIRAVCAEKTWVMPAHDRGLNNFNGKTREIDLMVAGESWNMATMIYWLGSRLSEETRNLVLRELEARTFTPFENMVKKGKPRMWWLECTNNWNAVCLAGVTGAALAVIESKERRAFFIHSAEAYIKYFLSGFTSDGYCSEGVGYWNYGFGHYVMLAETIKQATGGKRDLMEGEKIREIALFARRMEIRGRIFPAFADCSVTAKPDTPLLAYLSRRYGLGLKEVEAEGMLLKAGPTSSLFNLGLTRFPNTVTPLPPAPEEPVQPLRDWFKEAGILICRPAPAEKEALAVALKGGHNNEHHNHNDVGSFVVTWRGETPLVDPGSEVYTSRTFSSKRYQSKVLNSFGHPVPVVAGALQRTGRSAAAKALKTEFTDEADTYVIDMKSAYSVKALKKLVRTFTYSRKEKGALTVLDEVEFDSPQSFGTALITFSPWSSPSPDTLLFGKKDHRVRVQITTDSGEIALRTEEIHEDLPKGRIPHRVGLELTQPVKKAWIRLTITPELD